MSDRRLELANRREALLAKSDAQREILAQTTREIEMRLHGVDHVISMARRFVARPLLLAGGLAVIMMLGPRRLLSWAGRAVVLLSTGRRLMRRLR
jgi:hypothetical protein